MSVLALGTCRVYEPAAVLSARGCAIITARHRFHTVGEIEWGLRYLLDPSSMPDDLLFTLSDFALETLRQGPGRPAVAARDRICRVASRDQFIIEISSPREHFAVIGGREVRVNQLVATRVGMAAKVVIPSRKERLAAMARIRALLKGRILWVSHANVVEPSPEEAGLHRLRGGNAEVVRSGALKMGDEFYDPTALVASMGRNRVFANSGADLGHFTPEAHEALADIYGRWAGGQR